MRPRHQFVDYTEGMRISYRSNAQGFRRHADVAPEESRKPIIIVGDSYAFGLGVQYDDTYGALIESQLSGAVVYNMAMPGFGLDQMWLTVKYLALPLHPALVIVAMTTPDFERSQSAYRSYERLNKPTFKVGEGGLVRKTARDRPNPLVRFLDRHSYLWTAGRLASRWLVYRVPVGEWWPLNEAILDSIRADCHANGTPVLFVYHPSSALRPIPLLRSYMRRAEANYVDFTDGKLRPPQGSHYPHDGHLNPRGHRYVADRVCNWVQAHVPAFSEDRMR